MAVLENWPTGIDKSSVSSAVTVAVDVRVSLRDSVIVSTNRSLPEAADSV